MIVDDVAVMNPVTELICAVIEILALLGFEQQWMIRKLPLVVAIFALLLFAALFQGGAVLGSIKNLVKAAIRIAPAITMDEGVVREGLSADD